jgi:putative DNA methylase
VIAPVKKKLIEVALPLDAINAESAREKSIRHGHPSTLHLWWARRPLAACRAVLFSQLVDDPSSLPEEFPTQELQDAERQRLFRIIEDLVKWENTTNEDVLEAARAEIRRSCGGNPPPVLDPFAGGGSIPLEAQRLGLEAHASDLNPVAVLINKALIEIPPKFAGMAPVHPDAENRTRWNGAEGLAEDVRRYGQWMRDEAERRIGHLYPKASLPDGSKANVIAWVWARTVECSNPACGATMPLASTFWLSKKKGKEAWVQPIIDSKRVRFDIGHDPDGPPDPPKTGRGARFKCLVCGEAVGDTHIKAEGMAGRIGQQLMAVVADGDRRRVYLPATEEHIIAAASVARPADVPEQELVDEPRAIWCKLYGLTRHADLFTNRQLAALTTFSDLVGRAREKAEGDALAAGLRPEQASAYGRAVATYLGLGVSRLTDIQNSLCRWENSRGQVRNLFARQAIPMVWDFGEAGLFSRAAGDFETSLGSIVRSIQRLPSVGSGTATQRDARVIPNGFVIVTDPPYYDNIGYADLSDFFYVWLRRSLGPVFPKLFETMVTPKSDELIASPYRHEGSKDRAEDYFEDGFVDVFASARRTQAVGIPLTLFYAFKQSEDVGEDGIASTGWSTMLEGLHAAGWMVTATWPMRTELSNKIGMNANMLASSVVLACRPRLESAGITDRQGFLRALREELPGPIGELQKAAIAPVDLRQAAIGPGMAVFSRFAKVVEPDGEPMRVRTALGLINQVLETVLGEQEADFDPETRWAIQWFSQFYEDEGPFGTAESLAVSMNVAVDGLASSGILESGGGKARLLSRDELLDGWDPATDDRVPVWEATQHLIRRLESDGEVAAARLFRQLGGMADSCKALAYRMYDVCESSRPNLAGPYNMLAASWPEIQRLATQATAPIQTAEEQQLDI